MIVHCEENGIEITSSVCYNAFFFFFLIKQAVFVGLKSLPSCIDHNVTNHFEPSFDFFVVVFYVSIRHFTRQ